MTIIEALKISDKIKRRNWFGFIFWEETRWINDEGINYLMGPSTILATDWQPYESEKEKCGACKEADRVMSVFSDFTSTSYVMAQHLRQYHCQCKGDK